MVGLCERFDESMVLFRRALKLSLSDMLYVPQRITEKITRRSSILRASDIENDTVLRLRQIDELDFQLYSEAETLFKQQQRLTAEINGVNTELKLYRDALADRRHPLWRGRCGFKIGYVQGNEWGKLTEDGKYRQLRKLKG
jgi:hypothetical protein